MSIEITETAPAGIIDEKEMLRRLPISRRTLWNWRTSGKIPYIQLGGRRVLYDWDCVRASLLRQQRGGN
jgi:predicted site-specific integrase-resolvase